MKKIIEDKIKIVLIEDSEKFRQILKLIFLADNRFVLISEYRDAEKALTEIALLSPHVIFLDIDLGDNKMNGIQAVSYLKKICPLASVIMITVSNESQTIFDALCAGADGYLTKDISPEELLSSAYEAYRGGAPMTPFIAKKVVAFFQKNAPSNDVLTRQEKRVLEMTAEDKLDKEIALALNISSETVRFHFKNIYAKLQVHSKHGAIAKALKQNLI
ncbi:response regulator transcription factor [bacterium]|nr:response regulator transcription factor [bacterium]